jgi:glycosyltransferase involved in cell wall biosynthesis
VLRAVPNGFDEKAFRPASRDRLAHWRAHLPGEAERLAEGLVLLYVGRFTEVKRVPLLIEAFARARDRFERDASLVLVGGHPGEWEGEHPQDSVDRLGVPGVFLAGWHDHSELPAFMQSSDALVMPSVREQFGQALVEAMACGLPVVAVDRCGPAEVVRPGQTGWLVGPDDAEGLAAAMTEVVNNHSERLRRGRAAAGDAVERWSWSAAAASLAGVFDEARGVATARAA